MYSFKINRAQQTLIKTLRVLAAATLILLMGCGPQGGSQISGPGENGGLSVPRAIQQAHLTNEDGTLSAYITVDDGSRQAMNIIENNTKVQLTINNLKPGKHTFNIEFEFQSTLFNKTYMLAYINPSIREKTLGPGANSLSFADSDYEYPDDNEDNESNLAALSKGENPKSCVLGYSRLGFCELGSSG